METLTLYNFLFLLVLAALATIAIWSPRQFVIKVVAIVFSAAAFFLANISLIDLLGRPKPTEWEWRYRDLKEAVVLSAKIVEGEGIYLWLDWPGLPEPRYYVRSWTEDGKQEGAEGEEGEKGSSKSPAEQLQDALRAQRSENNGAEIIIKYPFMDSLGIQEGDMDQRSDDDAWTEDRFERSLETRDRKEK